MNDEDLKSYIKSYYLDRKMTYTKLDKHDRAIGVLLEENKQLEDLLHKANDEVISYTNCCIDLKDKIDKAIENCKKSIESINQKLQDDKTIKVEDGKVVNMNEYQIVRLKAIRMKCKELLEILGDKE